MTITDTENATAESTAVRTGLQRVLGWRPPLWVHIQLQKRRHTYRVTRPGGEPFMVSARTHTECMRAIAEELLRRQVEGSWRG